MLVEISKQAKGGKYLVRNVGKAKALKTRQCKAMGRKAASATATSEQILMYDQTPLAKNGEEEIVSDEVEQVLSKIFDSA